MISQREVERRYNSTVDYYKYIHPHGVNCYVCEKCNYVLKTVDLVAGTTPMYLKCDNCHDGFMSSTWYVDNYFELPVTKEWYRPTLEQTLKMRKPNKTYMLEHVLNGGLELRQMKTKEEK